MSVVSVEVALLPPPGSLDWNNAEANGTLRSCALKGCKARVTFKDDDVWVCWDHGFIALRDVWGMWDPELTMRGVIRGTVQAPAAQKLIDDVAEGKKRGGLMDTDLEGEPPVHGLTHQERAALGAGRILESIKLIRERTGLSLKDAKAFLDKYR